MTELFAVLSPSSSSSILSRIFYPCCQRVYLQPGSDGMRRASVISLTPQNQIDSHFWKPAPRPNSISSHSVTDGRFVYGELRFRSRVQMHDIDAATRRYDGCVPSSRLATGSPKPLSLLSHLLLVTRTAESGYTYVRFAAYSARRGPVPKKRHWSIG